MFGNNNNGFGGGSIPPVPSLPSSVTGMMNGGGTNDGPASGVVRQPRGPGIGGFGSRRDRVIASESQIGRVGLEARSHEPLEL